MLEPDVPPTVLAFQRDMPCIHCTYNLRTMRLDVPCPECGKPAFHSLDALSVAVPRDVARVRLGVLLMALAASVVPMLGILCAVIGVSLPYSWRTDELEKLAGLTSLSSGWLVGPLIAGVGVVFASRLPRRGRHWQACAPLAQPMSLMAMRISAGLFLATTTVMFGLVSLMILEIVRSSHVESVALPTMITLAFVAAAAWTGRNMAACAWFGRLAGRGGSKSLARIFSFMQWLSFAALIVVLLSGTIVLTISIVELISPSFLRSFNDPIFGVLGVVLMAGYGIGWLATIGWLMLWPIVLLVFYLHLGRQLARARMYAEGLLGPADYGSMGPSVPPTRPASTGAADQRQNPQSPSPGETGTER